MEFTLDSENIQIIIKEDKINRYNNCGENSKFSSPNSQIDLLDLSNSSSVRYEILLKLDDYYLINNIKLLGELDEFQINKIKFQNVNTGLWEAVSYFNPDNHKEIKVRENNSLSIFSVGLTQFIKIEVLINVGNEVNFLSNRTLGIPEFDARNIIGNDEVNDNNNMRNYGGHNQSMQETIENSNNCAKKKRIFNLNLNMQKVNSMIGGQSESNQSNLNFNKANNYNTITYSANKKDNQIKNLNTQSNYAYYTKLLKSLLRKITVFSQYIYSIPNSTFLLTLLNIKNFFVNKLNEDYLPNENTNTNTTLTSKYENYLSSLFLTASSMIQARLFIQAWELFNQLQIHIINNINLNNFTLFRILLGLELESECETESRMISSNFSNRNKYNSADSNNSHTLIKSKVPTFLAKLEIIKAICMNEHGHTLAFLESLKNCINIFYFSDYSGIKLNISWTKNNEIGSDKFFIQNFIYNYGRNLGDILILLLKDQSEIISYASLKVIEFILDYNASILFAKFSKIIKLLLKRLYQYRKNEKNETGGKDYTKNDLDLEASNAKFNCEKLFEEKKIYFSKDLARAYRVNGSKKEKVNSYNNDNNNYNNNNTKATSSISPILLKQLNYTLDTLISNLDNVPNSQLQLIAEKTNLILIDILKNSDADSVLTMNIIKLIRKLYENLNTCTIDLFASAKQKMSKINYIHNGNDFPGHIINLLSICINPSLINQFKDFFTNQSTDPNTPAGKRSKSSQKQPFNFSNLSSNLIENSEIGNLVHLVFDKISEDCFLYKERESCIDLFSWMTDSLDIVRVLLKNNMRMTLVSSPAIEEEFVIFYCFIMLYLCNTLFFNKSEIKSEVNKIFVNKMHPDIVKTLTNFINILMDIEEICLHNKKCLIIFELVIDVLNKIKQSYSTTLKINFGLIFNEQYKNLLSFLHKNGIFNENIFYLLKTLPLIEINKEENSEDDFTKILQKIFLCILDNFSNYYSEDMFELFSLLLNKLKNNLNEEIINAVVTAIINKFNYKGISFKNCCNTFFNVILNSSRDESNNNLSEFEKTKDYFVMFKNNIISSTCKINNLNKCNNSNTSTGTGNKHFDVLKNKEIYIEFLEKLELYKKYLEFLKNEHNLEILFNIQLNLNVNVSNMMNSNENLSNKILNRITLILFNEIETAETLLDIAKINDDTIIVRLNEMLAESFELIEFILKFLCTTSSNVDNDNKLIHLLDNNFLAELLSVLSNHLNLTSEYFLVSNKMNRNPQLLSENFRAMTKINNSVINIAEYLSNVNSNLVKDSVVLSESVSKEVAFAFPKYEQYDQLNFKIKFFNSVVDSINFSHLKEVSLKTTIMEVMNFIETTIIRANDLYNYSSSDSAIKEYFSFLVPIINFFLESSDDFQKIFGIEIILKFFNIKFEDEKGFKTDAEVVNKLNFPSFIWEKILRLTDHFNYKISLFAVYVIQILAPREEITSLTRVRVDKPSKKSRIIELVENNNDKFFMNEEQINQLHLFIRDKIIFDCKPKNTLERNIDNDSRESNNNLNGNVHSMHLSGESDSEMMMNKVDEVNDYIDFIKIPNLDDDEKEEKLGQQNKDNEAKMNTDPNSNFATLNDIKVDNMSLEDLGVFEVEEEIFDNFDEENIPVIKNNYRRKKGSAEKLKTNQNTRNLLMSNHVKKENDYAEENVSNIQQINYSEKNQEENKNDFADEDSIPDLQIKKKNIRPQNGLRPATPPIKQLNKHLTNSNTNVQPTKPLNYNNNIDLPMNIDHHKRKNRNSDQNDKKYEIKSMEELFLDDEEEKNVNVVEVIDFAGQNNNVNDDLEIENEIEYNLEDNLDQDVDAEVEDRNDFDVDAEVDKDEKYNECVNEDLPNVHLSYEEEILNSFENLNLEDFKNLSSGTKKDNTKKIKIPGVDHPVLDQINEYLSHNSGGIKIEDYAEEVDNLLENDYNYIQTDEDPDQIIYQPISNFNKNKSLPLNNANIPLNNNIPKPNVNVNNILKNKNKFKPITKINKTFNQNSMTERFPSPNNKTSNDQSTSRIINIGQNFSGNDISGIHSKFKKINQKNIHNLHNLHKKNSMTYRVNSNIEENNNKNTSEFRKILRTKLTTDKILANLKKLSSDNNSIIAGHSRNEYQYNNENSVHGVSQGISRAMSHPEMRNRNYEEDNSNKQKSAAKNNNYMINTNLTESKYLVSSSNKTPNFNYNVSHHN